MKLNTHFGWQIGIMIDFGINYENRKYICLELPFITLQLFFKNTK